MKVEAIFIGELEPDWFSWLIQAWQSWVTGRKVNFSHAALLVNGTTVYDSTERGVAKCSLEEALDFGKAVIRHRFELPVIRACCAQTWLDRSVDVPYPQMWQLTAHFLPELWSNPEFGDGRKSASCSEYVSDFVHDMTAHPRSRFQKRDRIKPVDLYDRIEALQAR